jgi:hypothetical protein
MQGEAERGSLAPYDAQAITPTDRFLDRKVTAWGRTATIIEQAECGPRADGLPAVAVSTNCA